MVWMQQNRQELEAAFTQTAPAWDVMASYLGSNGIMDGDGKPPTAQAARAAWSRVKATTKAKTIALQPSSSPPASVQSAPVSAEPSSPPMPTPEADARFKPATLRNHTPSAPPPAPPVVQRPPARSPEEVQELMQRMTAGAPKRSF